jgi:prolyl-tRNA synthetase
MKFSELSIQTQRAAPSEFRRAGLAFLYRAGFLSRALESTALGQMLLEKLRQTYTNLESAPAQSADLPLEFFSGLGLSVLKSHESSEYFVPVENGADEILSCPRCAYTARHEAARAYRPPARFEEALPLEKVLTPECHTIAQLADFLHIPAEKTAKALMFTRELDGQFFFVVVRGDMQLSEAKLQAHTGAVRLASVPEIIASGAVPGYASPIGLRNTLVLVDALAASSPNLAAGANEPGFHFKNSNHARDYQADLVVDLALAGSGDLCPVCQTALGLVHAELVCENGIIQYQKLMLVLAEFHHDEKGLALPCGAHPFDVYLMNVPGKTMDTAQAAEDIYARLGAAGISVLFDDRNERAGVKFADADLIGCPVRVTVGERGLQSGVVELKERSASDNQLVPGAELVEKIKATL